MVNILPLDHGSTLVFGIFKEDESHTDLIVNGSVVLCKCICDETGVYKDFLKIIRKDDVGGWNARHAVNLGNEKDHFFVNTPLSNVLYMDRSSDKTFPLGYKNLSIYAILLYTVKDMLSGIDE